MLEPGKDESSLDALKKRLYTRGDMGRRPLHKGRLSTHEENMTESWREDTSDNFLEVKETKLPTSLFKKLFIGSIIFFILAAAYATYQFLAGGNIISSKNINVSVLGPAFAGGGEEISLQVSIENRNTLPLEYAELFVEYPKGAGSASASTTPDMVRLDIPLKKIPAGGDHQEIVKVTLYGEEGKEQTVKFNLEYRVAGSNAIFQKENTYPVRMSSSPINLTLDAPKEMNAGQELVLNLKVSSNAPKDVSGVTIEIDYPSGFLFKSSDPKATYGNNVWRLGDFHTGSSRLIKVIGALQGEDGDERTFRIIGGSASSGDEKTIGTVYSSIFQTMAVHRPFLDAKVTLNGDFSDNVAIPGGRTVRSEVVWKNNLPTRITNASIIVKLSGNAFNRAQVSTERGFYNSSESVIIWDKDSVPEFETIEPGATGKLPFAFTPTSLFSGGKGVLESPQINLLITVSGDVNSGNGGGGATTVTTGKTAKISTDLQILSRAVYSIGPFKNTGPLPPQAEKETTYTIMWSVMNSASPVTGATVVTILPPYVKWTGQTSPGNEDISYDEGTHTVIWRLGTVSASTGYLSAPREADFQIKFLPSLSHVGSSVSLTSEVTLAGLDSFANIPIQTEKSGMTTSLNNDPNFKSGDDVVVSPKP